MSHPHAMHAAILLGLVLLLGTCTWHSRHSHWHGDTHHERAGR